MMRVFKFGGALMKDAAGINRVISLMEEYGCEPLVVVVSAIGKTTNALEELIRLKNQNNIPALQREFFNLKHQHLQLVTELFPDHNDLLFNELEELFRRLWEALNNQYPDTFQAYDNVVSFGEEMASVLVEQTATARGLPLQRIHAATLIATDSNHTHAGIDWKSTRNNIESKVKPVLEAKKVVLTQGFVGADPHGHITTLGREGSDFTAAILGNLLHSDEVTIWKDVPGLMNADPNRFSECIKFDFLSYHEAIELAFYGATIIHPKTIQPLKQLNIPLYVRSFYNPDITPTCISNQSTEEEKTHSIIVKDHQVLLSVSTRDLSFIAEENLTRLFAAFSQNKIHINMMQHSAVSFSVCFDYHDEKLKQLRVDLEKEFETKYNSGLQLITLRHYTPFLIDFVTSDKEIFLEQRSRSTFQVLIK